MTALIFIAFSIIDQGYEAGNTGQLYINLFTKDCTFEVHHVSTFNVAQVSITGISVGLSRVEEPFKKNRNDVCKGE